jgi:hypothetical protein
MANDKKVEIEMKDGSKKSLSELTNNDLPNVKVASNDKGETNLTLKSVILNENTTHKTERRIYKWRTMPAVAMYDVKYGKTLPTLSKELGETNVYDYAIGNFLIEQDKVHNGVTGGKPLDEKIVSSAEKLGLPKAEIDKIKAIMRAHGFGK